MTFRCKIGSDRKKQDGGPPVTQKLTMLAIASVFAATSGVAFAQNPNDGPKYPNMESHKQFKEFRNEDHNNPSPRYSMATPTNKNYAAYRNQDHNNMSPRYAVTTKQTATPTIRAKNPRYLVRSTQRHVISRNHG
jgi:hypothetical protein